MGGAGGGGYSKGFRVLNGVDEVLVSFRQQLLMAGCLFSYSRPGFWIWV